MLARRWCCQPRGNSSSPILLAASSVLQIPVAMDHWTLGISEKYQIKIRRVGLRRWFAETTVNRYKVERLLHLGPDFACLEWLMKCGATSVLMSDGAAITSQQQMRNYIRGMGFDLRRPAKAPDTELMKNFNKNLLSAMRDERAYQERWPHVPAVHIKEVDASDAAIGDEGFRYFVECRAIEKMKLNFCDYFGDDAVRHLASGRARNSLVDLEIVLNSRLTDGAMPSLAKLRSLRRLHLYFLPYVANREAMARQLRLHLPRCRVSFPKSEVMGLGYEHELEERVAEKRRQQQDTPKPG